MPEAPKASPFNIQPLDLPKEPEERLSLVRRKIRELLSTPEKKIDFGPVNGVTLVAGNPSLGEPRSVPAVRQVGAANSETAASTSADYVSDLLKGDYRDPNNIQEVLTLTGQTGTFMVAVVNIVGRTSSLIKSFQQSTREWKSRESVFVIVSPTQIAGEASLWVVGRKGETVYVLSDGTRTTNIDLVGRFKPPQTEKVLKAEDHITGSLHVRFKKRSTIENNTLPMGAGNFARCGLYVLSSPSDIHDIHREESVEYCSELPVPLVSKPLVDELRKKYPYREVTPTNQEKQTLTPQSASTIPLIDQLLRDRGMLTNRPKDIKTWLEVSVRFYTETLNYPETAARYKKALEELNSGN